MKLSTRILSIIMAFAMIVSSMVVVASAEEATTDPTIAAVPGEIVDGILPVEIVLKNNPGIVSLKVALTYDETLFTLGEDAVVDAGVLGNACHSDNFDGPTYTLFWYNGTAEADYTVNGTIATLNFKVSDDLKLEDSYGAGQYKPGNYAFELAFDYYGKDAVNFDLDPVNFEVEDGALVIEEVFEVAIIEQGVGAIESVTLEDNGRIDLSPSITSNISGLTWGWTSGNPSIVSVGPNDGIVAPTNVGSGETTVTLTVYNSDGTVKGTASIPVTVTIANPVGGGSTEPDDGVVTEGGVAKIGDTQYNSVAKALEAATSGQTVTMIGNATENVVMINPGVTLNLGAYTLTANYVVGLKDSVLTGTVYGGAGVASGKLVAPKDNVLLDGNNATTVAGGRTYKVLPFWNGTDAYLFSIYDIYSITSAYYNSEQIYLEFAHQASKACRTDYFNNGIADNALEMTVTLTWSGPTGDYNQTYVFNENTIMDMSPAGTSARYYFILKGYEKLALDPTDFTMSVVLRSTTGLEVAQEASVAAQ